MAVLCLIYIYFYQPETTGRSYEELDELYIKKVPAREFKAFVTDAEKQGQEASKKIHS
jgi:MFS transporter, SP family, general alpha glucoside:H+ symporter